MGAHVVTSLCRDEDFMSDEIEKATIVAYVKDDADTGTELIINLFEKDGQRWVGISLGKDDPENQETSRTAIFMPYLQWQEMVKDMMRR